MRKILNKCDENEENLETREIKLQNTKCLTDVFDREIRKCDLKDAIKKRKKNFVKDKRKKNITEKENCNRKEEFPVKQSEENS